MSMEKNAIGRRSLLRGGATAAGLGLLTDLEAYPQNVNRNSLPSDLKITDMRIAVLRGPQGQAGAPGGRGPLPPATPGTGGASGGTIIVRIDTNQGISGYGQTIGDGPQPNYVLMHKTRVVGENPCNVDKIYRKIKIHGAYNRQGSGVNAIENALWDLGRQSLWRADLPNAWRESFATRSACTPRVHRARTTLKISPPITRKKSPLGLRCSKWI